MKEDDVQLLWNTITQSKVVVVGSPVYSPGIPDIFKNFMDRIAYNCHRPSFFGGPFINYAEKGYKIELLGTDTIANAISYKIKFTSPDSILSVYFFDARTFYLVQAVSQSVAACQIVESVTNYSDFRQADGLTIPYKTELSMAGGQYMNDMTVTKVELNKPVDGLIFKKPE